MKTEKTMSPGGMLVGRKSGGGGGGGVGVGTL